MRKLNLRTKTLPNINNNSANLISKKKSTNWTTCSDVFYLLDTVKISYHSPIGKITLEDIIAEKCTDCVASIKNLTKSNDCADCPFMVTVCGVTWDILECENKITQRRVRAIPKAAGLRFFYDNRVDSDAYFYQGSGVTLDSAPSDYFTDRKASEAKAVCQLTTEQFIQTLQQNNQQFIEAHGKPLYLNKANFEESMTEHEQTSFEKITKKNIHNAISD